MPSPNAIHIENSMQDLIFQYDNWNEVNFCDSDLGLKQTLQKQSNSIFLKLHTQEAI